MMMLIAKCEQMRHQLYLKRVSPGRVDTIGNLKWHISDISDPVVNYGKQIENFVQLIYFRFCRKLWAGNKHCTLFVYFHTSFIIFCMFLSSYWLYTTVVILTLLIFSVIHLFTGFLIVLFFFFTLHNACPAPHNTIHILCIDRGREVEAFLLKSFFLLGSDREEEKNERDSKLVHQIARKTSSSVWYVLKKNK